MTEQEREKFYRDMNRGRWLRETFDLVKAIVYFAAILGGMFFLATGVLGGVASMDMGNPISL